MILERCVRSLIPVFPFYHSVLHSLKVHFGFSLCDKATFLKHFCNSCSFLDVYFLVTDPRQPYAWGVGYCLINLYLILLYENLLPPQQGWNAPTPRKEVRRKEKGSEKGENEKDRSTEGEIPNPIKGK